MRIIDKDVAWYTGEVEEAHRRLRQCAPIREPYYRERLVKAQGALDALIIYRNAIDNQSED